MDFISPLLPNIVTGLSIGLSFGSTIGGCFLLYKFYEDYKRKIMYQKFQEQLKNITRSATFGFLIYLMIRGKVSKTFLKTLVSQYLGDHENTNVINAAIDQISDIFSQPHLNFGSDPAFVAPIVAPGLGSPFYNPEFDESAKTMKKATGLNFTSNTDKKVKKEPKKPTKCNNVYWDSSDESCEPISCSNYCPSDIKVNI